MIDNSGGLISPAPILVEQQDKVRVALWQTERSLLRTKTWRCNPSPLLDEHHQARKTGLDQRRAQQVFQPLVAAAGHDGGSDTAASPRHPLAVAR